MKQKVIKGYISKGNATTDLFCYNENGTLKTSIVEIRKDKRVFPYGYRKVEITIREIPTNKKEK